MSPRCKRAIDASYSVRRAAWASPCHACGGSELFASEVDCVLRALLGQAPEADYALPLELQGVLVYEQFLSVAGLYEGPVCAPVDQYEVAATDHDAGVQARAQAAFNYDVILVGTANGDARGTLIHYQFSVIEPQPQTHAGR